MPGGIKSMKILTVINPISKLNTASDTTLDWMRAASTNGHEVHYLVSRSLSQYNDTVKARTFRIRRPKEKGAKGRIYDKKTSTISEFDVVLMRQNPPLDRHYRLDVNMLDKAGVPIVNNPDCLRCYNAKTLALEYNQWTPPDTLVSRSLDVLMDHINDSTTADTWIAKPLSSYGGQGIERIKTNTATVRRRLREKTNRQTRSILVQPFLDDIKQSGDRRIALCGEKPVSWIQRNPPDNDYVANISQAGRSAKCVLTKREQELARTVGKDLAQKGAILAGIDVIGGYLIEVNITSPWFPPNQK